MDENSGSRVKLSNSSRSPNVRWVSKKGSRIFCQWKREAEMGLRCVRIILEVMTVLVGVEEGLGRNPLNLGFWNSKCPE